MRLEIKTGDVFNKLTVVRELPRLRIPSGQTNRCFECVCECGTIKSVRLAHLVRGKISSCGCKNRLLKKNTYTKEEKYIIRIYKAINDRCMPNAIDSHIYFKRGIGVCDEWKNNIFLFMDWAIKNGLKKGTHIDRIDNEKGYSAENCRVVTPIENANNKRNTIYIVYNGQKRAITELLRAIGMEDKMQTIKGRIKRGWNPQKAIETPIRQGNYKRRL